MDVTTKDARDRIERIETLLERLRAETAISREEAKVISESMAEESRRMQDISAFKKRRAELRRERIRPKTVQKR